MGAGIDLGAKVGASRAQCLRPPATPLTGRETCIVDFTYDGGGIGKGGEGTLTVDGKKVAEGRMEKTLPF